MDVEPIERRFRDLFGGGGGIIQLVAERAVDKGESVESFTAE